MNQQDNPCPHKDGHIHRGERTNCFKPDTHIHQEHVSSCSNPDTHIHWVEKEIDELLETIWTLREQGKIALSHLEGCGEGKVVLKNLEKLCSGDLVKIAEGHIRFTEKGEKRAYNIVRRHRLTERMLTDLFDFPPGKVESTACEFEHILSEEVTDSICSFLGHPPLCTHGKPIPPGECCKKMVRDIRPLVMPLGDLKAGETGRIVFIATKNRTRLQRLSSLGIVPGAVVKAEQTFPTLVITAGETEIAMDYNMVSDIYVKRINGF